jgi:2'-5' RNA ligase
MFAPPTSGLDLSAFKLYLGLALRETEELVQARAAICARLGLVPRAEAHITIAYVGQVRAIEVASLAAGLGASVTDELASLQLTGAGAAWEAEPGFPRLLSSENARDAEAHACVAWWCVERAPAITRLREAASQLLERLGRPLSATQPYAPHITLGSRGHAAIADAADDDDDDDDDDFDVYSLEKSATLRDLPTPARVLAARAHLAASKLLPASVVCLRAW